MEGDWNAEPCKVCLSQRCMLSDNRLTMSLSRFYRGSRLGDRGSRLGDNAEAVQPNDL